MGETKASKCWRVETEDRSDPRRARWTGKVMTGGGHAPVLCRRAASKPSVVQRSIKAIYAFFIFAFPLAETFPNTGFVSHSCCPAGRLSGAR